MEFPNEQELAAMKGIMDGEESVSRKDLKSGMQKIDAKSLYDLVLWGLRTGIIKDPPMPEIKNHAMADPKKFHEGYPIWLQYLSGLVSGYSDGDIDKEMHINRDQQAFYHKKIAIEFHLHPSKARLIRFAFQVLNPVKGPSASKVDWRPWTKSTISLLRVPQTHTGSQIDPEASITKKDTAIKALKLLKVPDFSSRKKSMWDMLELAKQRRDEEIQRLHPIANRIPQTPDQEKQIKMAEKQLAVVNAAWQRVRILFARQGYALPGDEELLRSQGRKIYIPGTRH